MAAVQFILFDEKLAKHADGVMQRDTFNVKCSLFTALTHSSKALNVSKRDSEIGSFEIDDNVVESLCLN